MKTISIFFLTVVVLSCQKEPDCSQIVTCYRTFATYSDCTPEDAAWDTIFWTTTESEPMTVCESEQWLEDMEDAQQRSYEAGDADWKRFLKTNPTECHCE